MAHQMGSRRIQLAFELQCYIQMLTEVFNSSYHQTTTGMNCWQLAQRPAGVWQLHCQPQGDKGCIKFDGAAVDFHCNMSILLNVAEMVMETHYDHHSAGPTNHTTQDLLSSSMNLMDMAVCNQLTHTQTKLAWVIDQTKRSLVETDGGQE